MSEGTTFLVEQAARMHQLKAVVQKGEPLPNPSMEGGCVNCENQEEIAEKLRRCEDILRQLFQVRAHISKDEVRAMLGQTLEVVGFRLAGTPTISMVWVYARVRGHPHDLQVKYHLNTIGVPDAVIRSWQTAA